MYGTSEFSNPQPQQVRSGPHADQPSESLDYPDLQLPGPILPIHEADPPFFLISRQGADLEHTHHKYVLCKERSIARRRCCGYCKIRIVPFEGEPPQGPYNGSYYHEECAMQCAPWDSARAPYRSSPKLSEIDREKPKRESSIASSKSEDQPLLGKKEKPEKKRNLFSESIRKAGSKLRDSWQSARAKQERRLAGGQGLQQNLETGRYSWVGRRKSKRVTRPQHRHCRENLRFLLDDPDF